MAGEPATFRLTQVLSGQRVLRKILVSHRPGTDARLSPLWQLLRRHGVDTLEKCTAWVVQRRDAVDTADDLPFPDGVQSMIGSEIPLPPVKN